MTDYAKLPKKNFLYKVSGLSRGVAAILIPKDRPKPVSVTGIGGLRMIENYFSESEDRHIMRFDGTKGSGPATARVKYEGGGVESFNIKNLSGRTDYAPGPWNGAQSEPSPDLPLPGQKPPSAKDVSEIMLPASYAADVRLVVAVVGGKLKACVPGDTAGRKWILSGRMGAGDFFAVAWARVPDGVPVVRHPLLGAWSYTDRKTWTDDFRTFGQAEPTPAPAPTPAPVPQSPEPLHSRTANTLTLRADFAAVVTRVDALANVIEPGNPSPMFIAATRSGNTWTLPQSLGSYPKGNRPNTWRIRLSGPPPAGVTYHTSIMQTFLREGDATTYPPTTRK